MNDYVDGFKESLSCKNLSKNTISSYIYDVSNFIDYMQNEYGEGLSNVKKAQILTYLVNLQKNGKSSSTISRNISTLKGFYEYLKKDKIVNDNPVLSIHSPKPIKKSPVILSEQEINILMQIPNTETFKGSRDSAILELLYSSGIQVTELINVKMSDVNYSAGIIFISGTKERVVPLGSTAKIAIDNYVNNFRSKKCKGDNEYLFVNVAGDAVSRQGIWKMLKYYEKKMEMDKELSPQILRNSFAVHLLTHGADLRTVQELMGHSSLSATQNYLQNVEFKSLEVFKKTFPRA